MKLKLPTMLGKATLTAGALSLILLSSCDKATEENSPASGDSPTSGLRSSNAEPGQEFEPNQVLVKFRKGTSEEVKSRILSRISGKVYEKIHNKYMVRLCDVDGVIVVDS